MTILDDYTNEELVEMMNTSASMWNLAQKLGYTNRSSGNYRTIRQNLDKRGLVIPKWLARGKTTRKKDNSEVFCENSTYDNQDLKRRIITQNLLDYKCSLCNVISWQGQPLSLQLDHINGINNDNRIENLRYLCPNCHSQTETWGTKGRRKKN